LIASIESLPRPVANVGDALSRLQPWLTLVSVAVAATSLLALVWAAWSSAPSIRSPAMRRSDSSPEQLVTMAWRAIQRANSGQANKTELDRQASDALVAAWDTVFGASTTKAPDSLPHQVARFCGLVELLRCPRRVSLTETLVVLRHMSRTSPFDSAIMSEEDFIANLAENGYDEDLKSRLLVHVRESSDSPTELIRRLRTENPTSS
jgi:hypothetical protein